MAKKKTTSKTDFSKPKRWFWMSSLLGILFIPFILLLASFGAFGFMPDHTVLENPRTNLATEVI